MTTPNGSIKFNDSTGSDTQASGLGPTTAQFGTTGSCAASSAVVTGITTTGVVAGDLFWGQTSTGRQFSVIATVDSGTQVTLDDTLAATHSGNLTWAIGGQRATIEHTSSRTLFVDQQGWQIHVEKGSGLQIVTSSVTFGAGGDLLISGDEWIEIRNTANSATFITTTSGRITYVTGIKFTNSNATKTSARVFETNQSSLNCVFVRCILGDSTNKLLGIAHTTFGSTLDLEFYDCEIQYFTARPLGPHRGYIYGCYIHHNDVALQFNNSGNTRFAVINSLVVNNTGDGIITDGGPFIIYGNTIHGNSGDGIDSSGSSFTSSVIVNNSITANGNYGWRPHVNQTRKTVFEDYNNFGNASDSTANTSGDVLTLSKGEHDLNVAAQYTNAGGNDFTIGTNIKIKGFPRATNNIGTNQSATKSYVDIGAAQRQEPEDYVKWFGLRR